MYFPYPMVVIGNRIRMLYRNVHKSTNHFTIKHPIYPPPPDSTDVYPHTQNATNTPPLYRTMGHYQGSDHMLIQTVLCRWGEAIATIRSQMQIVEETNRAVWRSCLKSTYVHIYLREYGVIGS